MSLGVLNNLSAMYAANNLNNTSNSLTTVLQQLSSGSKINSGADDAAGLSLVNGLQANSMALAQSQTNSAEGVGLLKVADGALSQVTNLLNRAVTLATEAANGTLNSSQDAAANSEYQSILSEINNIGATTTYNQQTVFGSVTAIYTGDSSTTGASIDELNIRSLSSSNVGDSGGTMSYSNGQSNVFLNLSTSTANAAETDTLNSSGTTTLQVDYLVKGSNGTTTSATTSISVGTGTSYDNTVDGMISAINSSGLGLTATFATQSQAGVQGGGTQTGIEITGGLVSAGVDPSSSSTSGTLDLSGLAAGSTLALGSTVSITQGSTSHTFTIDSTNNTLDGLSSAINAQSSLGVTASVITNGDGTQSLSLADSSSTGGALSVTTTAGTTQAPAFSAGTVGTTVAMQTTGTTVAGVQYVAAQGSAITVGTGSTNSASDQLTVGTSITLARGAQSMTFVVGSGTDNTTTNTYYTENAAGTTGGTTLGSLADAINAQSSTLGVFANVGATGLTITTGTFTSGTAAAGNIVGTVAATTGNVVSVSANNLTSASSSTTLALYNPTSGGVVGGGLPEITVLDTGAASAASDILSGTFTLNDASSGTAVSFTMNGTTDNWASLADAINASDLGVSASFVSNADGTAGHGGLVLTATANGTGNAITLGGSGISAGGNAIAIDASGTAQQTGVAGANVDVAATAILQLGTGTINDSTATLGGAITVNYNGASQTFIMGTDPGSTSSLHVAGAIYTGANSVDSLVTAINSAAMGGQTNALYAEGVSASAPGTGTGGIYLQGTAGVASSFTLTTVTTTSGKEAPLSVTSAVTKDGGGTATGTGSTAVTGVAGNNAVDNIVSATALSTNDTMSGQITIANGGVSNTFIIGSGSNSAVAGTFYTDNTDTGGTNYGNTLAGLASAVTALSTNHVTAQANTSGLTLTQSGTSTTYTGGNITTSANSLTDVTKGSFSTSTTGSLASSSDTLSGSLVFSVGSGATQTVTMADVTASGEAGTAQGLINYIHANASTLGVDATWVAAGGSSSFGQIQLTSGTEGASGTVNVSSSLTNLTDTTGGAALTYTATSAYNTGLSSGSNTIFDSTAGQTSTSAASFASNSKVGSGVATISYTDGAGQSLANTSLSSQAEAQATLTALNNAITAVAAQDGYIGAQINLLNSVSSVLSTQQQNVVSAQNAVQATDYATAASNMSKYEILSQTGISALAQANSMQQEVTKLLQ
jgi:flagellin